METTLGFEAREAIVLENEGKKIFGIFHRPLLDPHVKCPVVTIFHGFASHKIGRNRAYVKIAEDLTRKGIAAFRFDFRGSGDSEGDLSEMTIETLVSDGVKVLSFLKSHPSINSSKIGILGSSLGGAIAILAATFCSIQALVLWAAVASGPLWHQDWLEKNLLSSNKKEDPLQFYKGVGISNQFREQFAGLNAGEEIKKLDRVPLLYIQGEEDQSISSAHRTCFEQSRLKSQAETQFSLIPETDHSLGFSPYFPRVLAETTHWFKKYLG